MVNDILASATTIPGVTFIISSSHYKWENKTQYFVQFKFERDGTEFKVESTGNDHATLITSVWEEFTRRLYSAFSPAELAPAVLTSSIDAAE